MLIFQKYFVDILNILNEWFLRVIKKLIHRIGVFYFFLLRKQRIFFRSARLTVIASHTEQEAWFVGCYIYVVNVAWSIKREKAEENSKWKIQDKTI